jgi:hypothetical protein
VAIFTGHRDGRQDQRLAWSADSGRTWTRLPRPVLDLGLADFRDSKVFWYVSGKHSVMAVALPAEHRIAFYSSDGESVLTELIFPAPGQRRLRLCVEGGGPWVAGMSLARLSGP